MDKPKIADKDNYGLDILFVVSPSNARSMFMPFNFLYLSSYLEKHNFRTDIVDCHNKGLKANLDSIIHEIKEKNPRYIGLAAFVTDYNRLTELAKTIKKYSTAKILVGSAQASIAPRDFLYQGSPFDIVVRGEGELTLRQFLSEYDESQDNSHIKGIGYLQDGMVKINADRELMDLTECTMPAYEKLDMAWYARTSKFYIRYLPTSCAVIYIGRGCPFRCGFCAANAVWSTNVITQQNHIFRKRPLPVVIKELEILQNKYNFDFFYIMDDTFGVRENDVYDFCEAYRKSGLKMPWAANARSDCMRKKEIVKALREAGCIQLDFGVETGSPDLLKVIKKDITVEETIRAFSLCRANGIRTFANILLNLPGETESDLILTHRLLKKIKPTYVSVSVTQPYPGTEFHDKYLATPITKQEYDKLDRLNPPERTRIATHKLNLAKLELAWQLRYGACGPIDWNIFKTDSRYWKRIIRSNRRWSYLAYFITQIFIRAFLRRIKYTYIYLTKKEK